MAFLAIEEFTTIINHDLLNTLIEYNTDILDEIINTSVEEMKSYLFPIYETENLFSEEAERNKILMMYCKDICVYHVYSRFGFRKIPAIREVRYKAAIKWLEDVKVQKIVPEGLTTYEKNVIKTGSNEKRINQQQ